MVAPCIARPAAVQSSSSLCSSTPLDGQLGCRPRLRACSVSLNSRRRLGVRGGLDNDSSASQHVKSVQRPELRRASPLQNAEDTPLQTVTVEDESVSVEGVIKMEKEQSARPSWGRAVTLAGGDLLALFAFAAIGRMSHGMSAFDWEMVRTADPFVAGWLLGAYFLGGFGPEGQGLYGLRTAAISAIKSWAVGVPLGLAIRSFTMGHTPPQAFILVSLGSTFVLLVGWRTAFTTIFPNEDTSVKKDEGDRKGSVFEFFELLTSLVRRW